jgi:hypothetical protein
MSNRFATLVFVIAAVLAASQVGVVQVRRSEALALRRRLGDVQARCTGTEVALQKDLQAARLRSDWLQATLDRRAAEADRLRGELSAAQRALELVQVSASATQSNLDALRGAVDGAPEALRVELAPDADLRQLVARATNASGEPVEILEVSALLWLGSGTQGTGFSSAGAALPAGDSVELFEYDLFGDEPDQVRAGMQPLRAALCFVWHAGGPERMDSYWFEYRTDPGELALLRREGAPLAADVHGCDLEAAIPPW